MLDWGLHARLSFGRRGLVYILLGYWVGYTDVLGSFSWLSRMSFTPHVISSCNLLANIKILESIFFSLSTSDEATAS